MTRSRRRGWTSRGRRARVRGGGWGGRGTACTRTRRCSSGKSTSTFVFYHLETVTTWTSRAVKGGDVLLVCPHADDGRGESGRGEPSHEEDGDDALGERVLVFVQGIYVWPLQPVGAWARNCSAPPQRAAIRHTHPSRPRTPADNSMRVGGSQRHWMRLLGERFPVLSAWR